LGLEVGVWRLGLCYGFDFVYGVCILGWNVAVCLGVSWSLNLEFFFLEFGFESEFAVWV